LRAARAILLYALAVILVGALVAPWFYWLLHPHRPDIPFRRVFDRVFLGVALALLWPLLRALEINSWRAVGYVRFAGWWRHLWIGVAVGVLSLAVAGVLCLATGGRVIAISPAYRWYDPGLFLLIGLAVALVEETFFRGGLFGALRRCLPLWPAIITSSVIFSVVHFLKARGGKVGAETVTWLSGFTHLVQIAVDLPGQPGFIPGSISLLLAGCILALAFTRTRSLYLAIGLHIGWVFMIKMSGVLTDPAGARQWWNGLSVIDNVVDWPVLLVTLVVVDFLCRQKLAPLES
jgi:membrane protease YdiL (CAAX protease family)